MRKCLKCKEIKRLDNFYKNEFSYKDGYSTQCKICLKETRDYKNRKKIKSLKSNSIINYKKTLGKQITEIIKNSNLKKWEFARKIDISLDTLKKYEEGKILIPIWRLFLISKEFKVKFKIELNYYAK